MKYEIEHMLQNGGGSIVNTASGAGLISMPAIAIYSASKAATIHMTRVAGLTYAKRGIRVNCVCPGTVNTPAIHAMGIPDVENFFAPARSEEHTSELQSLMRISYAVFCWTTK